MYNEHMGDLPPSSGSKKLWKMIKMNENEVLNQDI